ncbi:hypothetical protein C8J57DRAFT_1722904, partial [Mycena rebaudengoi]
MSPTHWKDSLDLDDAFLHGGREFFGLTTMHRPRRVLVARRPSVTAPPTFEGLVRGNPQRLTAPGSQSVPRPRSPAPSLTLPAALDTSRRP